MALLVSACSSSSVPATFSLSNATVDANYSCPRGSSNAAYDLHATVHLHNPTAKLVTVESVSAELTLATIKGPWLEKIGDTYQVSSSSFGPGVVDAGGDVAMNVTIPSACTNGKTAPAVASYGDYRVKLDMVTTAGNYSIVGEDLHRITAA